MSQLPLTGAGPSAAGYIAKVKSYNPIAYWPLNETTGSTAVCQVNTAQNGTYTGVTLGQTVTDASGVSFICPLFDGANDFANIYTTTFRDAFDGAEGTAMIWARVYNVGVWTDGNNHVMGTLRVDANNQIFLKKDNTNNRKELVYEAGNVTETGVETGLAIIDWMQLFLTWSATTDEVKQYRDGSQVGITLTVLGAWAGQLVNTNTIIGSFDTGPTNPWYGWLAHCAVWDTILTQPQIADLAVA